MADAVDSGSVLLLPGYLMVMNFE